MVAGEKTAEDEEEDRLEHEHDWLGTKSRSRRAVPCVRQKISLRKMNLREPNALRLPNNHPEE
jgi:hypothetical protein